jgi:putative ABC transport system permease protein
LGTPTGRRDLQVVGVGAIIAELGLVAMTPLLVGALGRLGRWLPLSGRLALRDAARNRGRTAPAVAAVLAAVAGTVAVATYIVSDDAREEAEYVARLPHGGIGVIVSEADQLSSLHRTRELVEEELPTAERADTLRIVPGDRDCGVWYDGTEAADGCGRLELAVPAGKECPLGAEDELREGRPEYSDEEIRDFYEDGRCADPAEGWWAYRVDPPVLVAGPELLSVLEISTDIVVLCAMDVPSVRSLRKELDALRVALAAADFEQLRQLGHRMRGVGTSYGFERVSSLVKQFVEGARARDKASLESDIAAYGDYLSKLQVAYE